MNVLLDKIHFTRILSSKELSSMAFIVKNNIQWVGKQDWELREFHGSEYSTHRGSSYNSYLIKEEKLP
jgi:flavorubredoxin